MSLLFLSIYPWKLLPLACNPMSMKKTVYYILA